MQVKMCSLQHNKPVGPTWNHPLEAISSPPEVGIEADHTRHMANKTGAFLLAIGGHECRRTILCVKCESIGNWRRNKSQVPFIIGWGLKFSYNETSPSRFTSSLPNEGDSSLFRRGSNSTKCASLCFLDYLLSKRQRALEAADRNVRFLSVNCSCEQALRKGVADLQNQRHDQISGAKRRHLEKEIKWRLLIGWKFWWKLSTLSSRPSYSQTRPSWPQYRFNHLSRFYYLFLMHSNALRASSHESTSGLLVFNTYEAVPMLSK